MENELNELKLEKILMKGEIREESKRWEKERNELKEEIREVKETMQLWRLEEEKRKAEESEERESVNSAAGSNQEDEAEQSEKTGTIEKDANNNSRILEDGKRKYLREIPDSLGKGEYEWEMKERKERRKNIMIRGVKTMGKDLKKEVKEIIRKYLDIEIYIRNIRAIGGGLVLELESFENKIQIMKRKARLAGTKIELIDDFTQRELEVREWLEKLRDCETGLGLRVRTGYMKVNVDGYWYVWNEREGRLLEMETFREEGEEKREERR